MSNEWFLECLANPWIFNTVFEFQREVQEGAIIESDGSGSLVFVNRETLQLEESDEYCFKDGLDIWKIAEWEERRAFPEETIKRIISHFSDDKRQLIGVMWYNR